VEKIPLKPHYLSKEIRYINVEVIKSSIFKSQVYLDTYMFKMCKIINDDEKYAVISRRDGYMHDGIKYADVWETRVEFFNSLRSAEERYNYLVEKYSKHHIKITKNDVNTMKEVKGGEIL